MEDSFFKFGQATFGSQKQDGDLLTADVEEDAYDALNNETFGGAIFDGDWEEDHEKLAELISPVKDLTLSHYDDLTEGHDGSKEIIEQSLSQLGLEDDMDDTEIKTYVKSCQTRPFHSFRSSPPPPAIIDAEECGSPKTRTIWSTDSVPSTPPNSRLEFLLKSLQSPRNSSASHDTLPFVLPHGENAGSRSPSLPVNARRLEDVERDLLQSDGWRATPVHAENLEQELFNYDNKWGGDKTNKKGGWSTTSLPAQAQTLDEIEKDALYNTQMADDLEGFLRGSAPHGPAARTEGQRPPPGFPNIMAFGNAMNRSTQPPIGTPPQSTGIFSHLTGTPVCTSPIPIGHMPPMVVTNLFRPPQMSPPVHPLLNTQHMAAPFPHPNGLSVNMQRNTMHPPPMPLDPNILAQADLRRLLYPRQINHPFLNKQWIPQTSQPPPNIIQHCRQSSLNRPPPCDEYSGLMTQREKEWLIKIQMLQLHTDNPYVDDYYHTTYIMRKMMREKRKADGKDVKLVLPEMGRPENKAYVPVQFENSLGKLQAISVNFPRRVLEMDVQLPWAEEDNRLPANKELHRQRRLLLEIEKLYSVLLEIDDEEKRMLALPDEARIPHHQKREKLIDYLFDSFGAKNLDEKLGQIACIRKGRHLFFRAMVHFTHPQQVVLLASLLRSLGSIVRRDVNDRILVHYLPEMEDIIAKCSFADLTTLGLGLKSGMPMETNNGGVLQSSRDRGNFIAALHSQFGVTVIARLFSKAETIYLDEENLKNDLESEWNQIVHHIVNAICSLPVIGFHNNMTQDFLLHLNRFQLDEEKKQILKAKIAVK